MNIWQLLGIGGKETGGSCSYRASSTTYGSRPAQEALDALAATRPEDHVVLVYRSGGSGYYNVRGEMVEPNPGDPKKTRIKVYTTVGARQPGEVVAVGDILGAGGSYGLSRILTGEVKYNSEDAGYQEMMAKMMALRAPDEMRAELTDPIMGGTRYMTGNVLSHSEDPMETAFAIRQSANGWKSGAEMTFGDLFGDTHSQVSDVSTVVQRKMVGDWMRAFEDRYSRNGARLECFYGENGQSGRVLLSVGERRPATPDSFAVLESTNGHVLGNVVPRRTLFEMDGLPLQDSRVTGRG